MRSRSHGSIIVSTRVYFSERVYHPGAKIDTSCLTCLFVSIRVYLLGQFVFFGVYLFRCTCLSFRVSVSIVCECPCLSAVAVLSQFGPTSQAPFPKSHHFKASWAKHLLRNLMSKMCLLDSLEVGSVRRDNNSKHTCLNL